MKNLEGFHREFGVIVVLSFALLAIVFGVLAYRGASAKLNIVVSTPTEVRDISWIKEGTMYWTYIDSTNAKPLLLVWHYLDWQIADRNLGLVWKTQEEAQKWIDDQRQSVRF